MLPPHELKTNKFAKVFHGYSPEEVDDRIAFLLEQYTSLYRENDELERKLRTALAQLDSYKNDEESIRSALVNAQKAGGKVLRDASERAELLLQATKETCDRLVAESAIAIRDQMALLEQLRTQTRVFRTTLLEQYRAQLALIEEGAVSEADIGLEQLADEEIVRKIIRGIKEEASRLSEKEVSPLPPTGKQRTGTIWNKETARNEPPASKPAAQNEEASAASEPQNEPDEPLTTDAIAALPEETDAREVPADHKNEIEALPAAQVTAGDEDVPSTDAPEDKSSGPANTTALA